jgi:hypothetical protein
MMLKSRMKEMSCHHHRRKHAKDLFRLVLNYHRRQLGMSTDIDVERERAKFIAAIGNGDRTDIARLAADIEADRVLKATAADGVILSAAERATFREMVRTATLDGAASLGLVPPPGSSQLARLDTFLAYREAARETVLQQATSSSSAVH